MTEAINLLHKFPGETLYSAQTRQSISEDYEDDLWLGKQLLQGKESTT